MKIIVEADNTGFAPPAERYVAFDDNTYDPGNPIGSGPTPAAAIADLMLQLEGEG